MFKARVLEQIAQVDAAQWNALLNDEQPFLKHEFLSALEQTDCVSAETGWLPQHIVLQDENEKLLAAMPLYLKSHSWGEFVFDWAWADAYRRAGLEYYPKLLGAVPFSPVTGHRLLTRRAQQDSTQLTEQLIATATALADQLALSSFHVLFPRVEELSGLRNAGFLLRKDCQFHWRNQAFRDFDHYLESFSSKKRKNVKRERRRAREAGLSFHWYRGDAMDELLWQDAYRFHASTFQKRGNPPYLSAACFDLLSQSLGEQLQVLLVRDGTRPVACAIFLRDSRTLYGRYWGCESEYHSLHFETCYYQGIDYCIANGLQRFEPGTQGEHKLSRGFEPTTTWSAHRLADPRFAGAIDEYLQREQTHIDSYVEQAARHLPFRQTDGDER